MNTVSKNLTQSILILMLVFLSVVVVAQKKNKPEGQENIQALKVAFITDKLALSPEEAEKFWPLYNEAGDAIHALHKKMHDEFDFEEKDALEFSDAEAEAFLEKKMAMDQEVLDIKKQLIDDLKDVISPQKIIIMEGAEHEFRKELLNKLRGPKDGKRGGPPPFNDKRNFRQSRF